MAKGKSQASKRVQKSSSIQMTPEDAIQFLEDFRKLASGLDEPTQPVSIRIPANILRAVKLQAKKEGKKYQSLIVEYVRRGLSR